MKLWNDLRGWAGANAAALRLLLPYDRCRDFSAYVLAEFFALPQGLLEFFFQRSSSCKRASVAPSKPLSTA